MYKAKKTTDSSLESLIKRATDETLTTNNWEYIIAVCDKVKSDPEVATKKAITILTTRLQSKDANVLLRTLSLIIALGENCGSRMQQEIASEAFLKPLTKKLKEKKLHETVKVEIAKLIEQLHQSFKSDPSLKPMSDAYNKIKQEHPRYLERNVPAKPEKHDVSSKTQSEEDELQRVINLSLQEYEREQFSKSLQKPLPDPKKTSPRNANIAQEDSDDKKPEISKVRAMFDLVSHEKDELSFRKGDLINVIEVVYRDWWRGSLPTGEVGIFPLNYVAPVYAKSSDQIEKELQIENRLLNVESKKIDKVLAMLSAATNGNENIDDEELENLYGQVSGLRSQLGHLIMKHTQREKELKLLNEQLAIEDKAFHDLLDKSISSFSNRNSYISSDVVPYPTGGNGSVNSGYPAVPNAYSGYNTYNGNGTPLAMQPTSLGFGNSIYASQPQQQPPRQVSQQMPPQDYQSYSNINSFPEVDRM
ncbi:predicted protein [Scheffersomyces stipitis CBS 6054]|uniref:Class E vacuolar protein-sorting machinery protein HSE1 n=1 Tax=Scheffersomyces stipitis (strain ATCC 58785 / CBS 6054 / NBRC 10063 / NRRL Y-11545) TaxID=322104 RepID=HSE1_PICST|nr:predicted protein [Scheffersomyces stipitis CBS 6054]A3LXQ8.2 RecName: Full=Class E vacuolar protein-sorting machinery protein HSE1 [Scheffersomyces stipitis CBS 6054]ABN67508.2 predicted protein [Scheffersomyces stipitis CBS 6054]KAG2732217.1 hypothetical protein G9P44_004634 [Scheffersomyces stipitis]